MAPKVAARVAYAAAGTNLLAATAMLLLLRPGLPVPGTSSEDRWRFVTEHAAVWRGGWLFWHAAALALLAFYVALAARWQRQAPVRCGLAVLCAAAGLAADLGAQAIAMGVAPRLDAQAFAVAEDISGVLTGYLGNGLYTCAGMLLVWAGARELPRRLVVLSIPVWAAGLALSVAAILRSPAGQLWSTAALMPAFVCWAALTGRWLSRCAS